MIRVDDLAAEVGLSVSSLDRHFRAATSMSPVQYQKQIRLQRARIRLLASPGDVAGAGHAVGYTSASQFTREYRGCSAPRRARTPPNSRTQTAPPTDRRAEVSPAGPRLTGGVSGRQSFLRGKTRLATDAVPMTANSATRTDDGMVVVPLTG